MATKMLSNETMAHLNRVAEQIEKVFNEISEQLMQRKQVLLQKLFQLQDEFQDKENTRIEAMEALIKAQKLMAELRLKEHTEIPSHLQAGLLCKEELKKLEIPTKLPNITLNCTNLPSLKSEISVFGEIITRKSMNYTLKRVASFSAVKLGKGHNEIADPKGIALDDLNQRAYVADFVSSCIKVFSFEGEFITQLGADVLLAPWGVAVAEAHVFVTDWVQHTVFQFHKDTQQLVRSGGAKESSGNNLLCPRGICVDTNGEIYIADSRKDRVSIFSGNLTFSTSIGKGVLEYPQDVKLSQESLVVLDRGQKCMKIFSKSGHMLASYVSQGDKKDRLVDRPYFFCLDPDMNFLVSDCGNNTIKIFTKSGSLISSLGKKGKSKGQFIEPEGIAVSNSGRIFVVSLNSKYAFQYF